MRAARGAAVGATVLALAVGGPATGASAGGGDQPGPVDLELKVERMESAQQADVVGAEGSAMLFDPEVAAAVEASAEAERREQQARTDALFREAGTALREPTSTTGLFEPGTVGGARAVRGEADVADAAAPGAAGTGSSAGPAALVALLVGGAGGSAALRGRGVRGA